ncbi:NAD kinase [Levilactobacillus bambusae]|uniref:NAD kinase n=1 Tax=Levilactobacillus bambusae TaxID=2024736 RepID=A0A2V1N0T1_9LACO|nr:NAD kinase [Levilactobacillus bambusae]PWG00623.1 NAD kinase [Levilactobacillus bambusae]
MRVAVFSNNGEASQRVALALRSGIVARGITIDGLNPEVVITVGGDGTLLSAFHHYSDLLDKVRFVGIHTGHLGFYTDWRDYEVNELIDSLVHDNGQSVSYPLLDIQVNYADGMGQPDHALALNESTLKKVSGTMVANVYIKDEFFESFRGDGLCISTPTGSTAYNKSIGGAILNPQFNAIQMSEISSINNRVFRTLGSPLIIASNEWIRIEPANTVNNILMCDQLMVEGRPVESIIYRVAKQRISFAAYRHTHFWKRVEDSFIGRDDA